MKIGVLLVSISFLVSKLIGLLRDNLLASNFGASTGESIFNLDIYYAAFRLPDLLFNLLSYGVISSAFVPLFVEILKKEGKSSAFRFSNEILHALAVSVIGISAILFFAAPILLPLFVPGFDEAQLDITVKATRIMLITPVLFTISGIAGGIQNAFHTFVGFSLAPIVYNLGIIGGIVMGGKQFGVYGIAWGVVAGASAHLLVQLPSIIRAGYRYEIALRWWNNRLKEMIRLAIPRIIGMSVTQFSLVVDTIIASTLAVGSISIINFASNLYYIPIGVIGISIATVSFGKFAEFAAIGDIARLSELAIIALRRILWLIIPLTFAMFMLRFELVELLFGYGKFSASDIRLTANTLGVLLSGLIFGVLMFTLARAFYALKDTKTPVLISIIAFALNVGLSLFFTKIMTLGVFGLALANAIAQTVNALILIELLSRRLKKVMLPVVEILKFFVSTLIMIAAIYFIKMVFEGILMQTIAAVFIGAAVYLGMCRILGCVDLYRVKE